MLLSCLYLGSVPASRLVVEWMHQVKHPLGRAAMTGRRDVRDVFSRLRLLDGRRQSVRFDLSLRGISDRHGC